MLRYCAVMTLRAPAARSARAFAAVPEFNYEPLIQTTSPDATPYRKISSQYVSTIEVDGRKVLKVEPEALALLSKTAMIDIAHLLRPAHLAQLEKILHDPEASDNDRFVAMELLKNANIAAGMILPGCQDTGTAIVMGKRGQNVWTNGNDEEALSLGVFDAYTQSNLRYSQVAPQDMFKEVNTGSNLPAQIDLFATDGSEYHFQFMAKGGGSANKTFLFQETKALLNPVRFKEFVAEKVALIGTAACPPYHLALAVGGLSAEMTLKAVKLASTKYYDRLPTTGSAGGRVYRDLQMEAQIHEMTQKMGIGAQFGGKYFCHDVRVIRLPRHGASCPVGLGVSCSADRQALGKITEEGIFIEALETDPGKYLPEVQTEALTESEVKININDGMDAMLATLDQLPVSSRVSLSGTLVVARDIAHAKIQERLDAGEEMPWYLKEFPVYYAGPAKTPKGMPSGSFGPTTAGRMDSYVDSFQSHGGSMVMLAKGNRSKAVTKACNKHGGFYLGSPGGPAALLASKCIQKVEVLEYEELGMEAIWKIEVVNFPAFVIVDNKGNDFFKKWLG